MPIARPSRPELVVAGSVVGLRPIKARETKENLGGDLYIQTLNGDQLTVTGWDRDLPDEFSPRVGDALVLICYPAPGRTGDQLTIVREATENDIDQLVSFSGVEAKKAA